MYTIISWFSNTYFPVTKGLISPTKVSVELFLFEEEDLIEKPIVLIFASESRQS